jgi:hypothetical protein
MEGEATRHIGDHADPRIRPQLPEACRRNAEHRRIPGVDQAVRAGLDEDPHPDPPLSFEGRATPGS